MDDMDDEKGVALAFYDRMRDIKKAARRAKVSADALRRWILERDRESAVPVKPVPPLPPVPPVALALPDNHQEAGGDDETDEADEEEGEDENEDENPYTRPYPPEFMQNPMRTPARCVPAPELDRWFRAVFVDEGGPLYNPDLWFFQLAHVGFVWTNVAKVAKGNVVAGMAEIPLQGSKEAWAKAREEQQLSEWFGKKPDFMITLDATYCWASDDREFCRLMFHEGFHCNYKTDEDGEMRMNEDKETGEETPCWKLIGHHVEDFVDGMELFGKEACAGRAFEFVEASTKKPKYSDDDIARACGRVP